MKSLFLRIFLWFWIAMVVMAVVLVVTSPYFTQSRSRVERWQQGAETWTGERVDRTARSISEGGVDGLRFGEPRGPGRRGSITFVFDDAGREVMGREAPKEATDLALGWRRPEPKKRSVEESFTWWQNRRRLPTGDGLWWWGPCTGRRGRSICWNRRLCGRASRPSRR